MLYITLYASLQTVIWTCVRSLSNATNFATVWHWTDSISCLHNNISCSAFVSQSLQYCNRLVALCGKVSFICSIFIWIFQFCANCICCVTCKISMFVLNGKLQRETLSDRTRSYIMVAFDDETMMWWETFDDRAVHSTLSDRTMIWWHLITVLCSLTDTSTYE